MQRCVPSVSDSVGARGCFRCEEEDKEAKEEEEEEEEVEDDGGRRRKRREEGEEGENLSCAETRHRVGE